MKHSETINRRQLIRRMTAITLGSAAAPLLSSAANTGSTFLQDTPAMVYIAPGEGKKALVGDMNITFKLNSSHTSGMLGVWETIIQPGELGAPPHYHKKTDEICRVLEGTVFIMTGDTVTEVKEGGWHLRPRGVVHTFWNSGKKPARTIDFCIPGGHEKYMEELAALFENGNRPKPADFKMLSEKHDINYRYDLLQAIMDTYKVKL